MRKWTAGNKPDLVDRAEIGERLGVSAATISRWHRRSILPEPDLKFGPIEVWKWETIGEWSKDHSRFGKRFRRTEMPDLVDLAGIADRLELNQKIIENWHRNRRLPVADYRWAAGDLWLWETVDVWKESQLAGRSFGLPTRSDSPGTMRSGRPSGPRLNIPGVPPNPAPTAIAPAARVEVSPPVAIPVLVTAVAPIEVTVPGPFASAVAPVEVTVPGPFASAVAPVEVPTPGPFASAFAPVEVPTPGPFASAFAPIEVTTPGPFASAVAPIEVPPPIDHRQAAVPVRAVASPMEVPDAVDVTPRGPRSSDPLGDIERLGAYFSKMAETLR